MSRRLPWKVIRLVKRSGLDDRARRSIFRVLNFAATVLDEAIVWALAKVGIRLFYGDAVARLWVDELIAWGES